MTRPRLFLSHSSKDARTVGDLITFLKTQEVDLKVDQEVLAPSCPIGDTLRSEINLSHGCLWVATKDSVASSWCPVEVGAFWGAGKPIIIFNPDAIDIGGPFHDIKYARNYEELKAAISLIKIPVETLGGLPVSQAASLIRSSVTTGLASLTDRMRAIQQLLPSMAKIAKYLEVQNTFLPNHAAILGRIAGMMNRNPRKVVCAFDVPSFGSVSAQVDYRKCADALDRYAACEEWEMAIYLLPADVGAKIVATEFSETSRQWQAWDEDLQALERFKRYETKARQAAKRANRLFSIGWLAVNRDSGGAPVGLHSMPLNVWIADGSEAVFSTVIDNYHPSPTTPQSDKSKPLVQEIGFFTQNPDMVRFLSSIMEKYTQNVDPTISLEAQIVATRVRVGELSRATQSLEKAANP